MDTAPPITHLSLCSGYGGIGLGLRKALPSLRDIAHVEIEAFACANLVAKMEEGKLDAAPIYTDLKTFPFRSFCGKVDILSGGFPCQPFSVAGKREATADERHLFPHILRGIAECRPAIVFLENVPGIITAKMPDEKTSVLYHVLCSLEGQGYEVEAGIFSAEEVGAPHQRKRVFIMAHAINSSDNSQQGGDGKEEKISGEHREEVCTGMPSGAVNELSNTNSERLESDELSSRSKKEFTTTPFFCSNDGRTKYPARPNEQQYEWEEPRTQPKMGRANNGFRSWVDEIRLLGNGVNPDTAEVAIIEFLKKIYE